MSLTESIVPQGREAALEGFLLRRGDGEPVGRGGRGMNLRMPFRPSLSASSASSASPREPIPGLRPARNRRLNP